jgi:hypothetical protein
MNARTKLRWADIPRHALREGLARAQGGVQILLITGDDRPSAGLVAAATSSSELPPAGPPADQLH